MNTLLDILYGGSNTANNLWVGVVPFSQAVNIGTGNSGWLDSTYDATLDFGPTITGTSCQGYTGNTTDPHRRRRLSPARRRPASLPSPATPPTEKPLSLNGVTWTFVSGTASGNQTKIGASLSTTLTTLASNLNASTNTSIKLATYYATSNALDITYKTTGSAGNAYTLAAGTAANTAVTARASTGTYASTPTCTYTLNGKGAAARFAQMNNWGGCVMARSSPYDTSDDTPSATSLSRPMTIRRCRRRRHEL